MTEYIMFILYLQFLQQVTKKLLLIDTRERQIHFIHIIRIYYNDIY